MRGSNWNICRVFPASRSSASPRVPSLATTAATATIARGIGAKAELTKRLSLDAEVSGGTGGFGSRNRLNHRLGEGSEAYVGYALNADRTDIGQEPQNLLSQSDRGMLTVGHAPPLQRRAVGVRRIAGRVRRQGTRAEPHLRPDLRPDQASVSLGHVREWPDRRRRQRPVRRTAGSLSNRLHQEGIRLGTAIEARRRTWAGPRSDSMAAAQRRVLSGRSGLARRRQVQHCHRQQFGHFVDQRRRIHRSDAGAGLSSGRQRALQCSGLRATYFADLGPVGQITGSGRTQSPKQVSTVISADTSYRPESRA